MKDLSDFRISYDKLSLIEQQLPKEPIKLFQIWFEELCKSNSMISRNNNDKSTLLKMPLDTDFITVKIYLFTVILIYHLFKNEFFIKKFSWPYNT